MVRVPAMAAATLSEASKVSSLNSSRCCAVGHVIGRRYVSAMQQARQAAVGLEEARGTGRTSRTHTM